VLVAVDGGVDFVAGVVVVAAAVVVDIGVVVDDNVDNIVVADYAAVVLDEIVGVQDFACLP
jgi:phosphatidylglycerophosphatase A